LPLDPSDQALSRHTPPVRMGAQAEGAGLSVVFFLSLYTIVLVPYTIYKLCNLSEEKQVVKPWAKVSVCLQVWHDAGNKDQADCD
jgi:hypothetical protein